MILLVDFGHPIAIGLIIGLLFFVVFVELIFDFFTEHIKDMLWEENWTVGVVEVILGFSYL